MFIIWYGRGKTTYYYTGSCAAGNDSIWTKKRSDATEYDDVNKALDQCEVLQREVDYKVNVSDK